MLCRIKADFQAKKFMKKFISFLATIVLVFSISAICANAFTIPSDSKSCSITSAQSYNYSAYVVGKNKYYGGQNYSTSSHSLTVIAQKYDSSSDEFVTDVKHSIGKNESFEMEETSKLSASTSWRVYLKPYGIFSNGCNGRGYIWHT